MLLLLLLLVLLLLQLQQPNCFAHLISAAVAAGVVAGVARVVGGAAVAAAGEAATGEAAGEEAAAVAAATAAEAGTDLHGDLEQQTMLTGSPHPSSHWLVSGVRGVSGPRPDVAGCHQLPTLPKGILGLAQAQAPPS